jgi:hypothetical protein
MEYNENRELIDQESYFYFKETNLIPDYLKLNKYRFPSFQLNKFVNEVKQEGSVLKPRGYLSFNESYIVENLMRRCFNKCRQFILEDWIDYDELDCTMRCTLLHKNSLQMMKESHKKK